MVQPEVGHLEEPMDVDHQDTQSETHFVGNPKDRFSHIFFLYSDKVRLMSQLPYCFK